MQLGSHSVSWSWMLPHVPSPVALYLLHFIQLISSSTPLVLEICHPSLVCTTVLQVQATVPTNWIEFEQSFGNTGIPGRERIGSR